MEEIIEKRIRVVRDEMDAEFIAESGFKMAFETENKNLDKPTVIEGVKSIIRKPKYGEYLIADVRL